ncbi:hypothetical protein SAMN02745945_00210 [Peptoclostridium litorale DSM 5388]|uniref:Uncharacterized protein n=1 Tax=Peptoclostridium litorale DSM 5388 TaxID=1121324 RepID=A0A069RIC8_PEPLI|nr:hypothetical protein CLIT_2c01490 [Peptoclostridium litorale DSM 5388]SIN69341.1 hypothetical protein SAMN02745945_00210 [Peptoclostridium litorale DSM 5388]
MDSKTINKKLIAISGIVCLIVAVLNFKSHRYFYGLSMVAFSIFAIYGILRSSNE